MATAVIQGCFVALLCLTFEAQQARAMMTILPLVTSRECQTDFDGNDILSLRRDDLYTVSPHTVQSIQSGPQASSLNQEPNKN